MSVVLPSFLVYTIRIEPDHSRVSFKSTDRIMTDSLSGFAAVWGHSAGGGRNPADVAWIDEKIAAFFLETASFSLATGVI